MKYMIENNLFNSTTSIYIKFASTKVTCKKNTYENLIGFSKGGVFFLEEASFSEEESLYLNNSALYGGCIYCLKCKS